MGRQRPLLEVPEKPPSCLVEPAPNRANRYAAQGSDCGIRMDVGEVAQQYDVPQRFAQIVQCGPQPVTLPSAVEQLLRIWASRKCGVRDLGNGDRVSLSAQSCERQ